jgi:hypothetical protein
MTSRNVTDLEALVKYCDKRRVFTPLTNHLTRSRKGRMNPDHLDGSSSPALSIEGEGTCTAVTVTGSPCRMKPKKGTRLCHAHSLTPEARREQSQRAAKASAEIRRERAKERQERVEEARIEARLGIEHHIARLADERDEEIAEALIARAIAAPDSRAMTMLLERRLGKVPDHLITSDQEEPFHMTEERLWQWMNEHPEGAPED